MERRPRVFISHAGSDLEVVISVVEKLANCDIEPIFDRRRCEAGDSIVRFMNDALREADHCLLLWSKAASRSPWVAAEWEAAFAKSIDNAHAFLILARLDECPLPSLLLPRLCVELFPQIQPGIEAICRRVSRDLDVSLSEGKPLLPFAPPEAPRQFEVYLTSRLFDVVTVQ